MEKNTMNIDTVWPKDLLYWRRMGSKDISDYVANTPPEKRLILIVWGVLESHGPSLGVGSDSMLSALAADEVARRLYEEGIQPIVFDGWKDVGSRSATWKFPGAVGFHSSIPVIREIWEQTLTRMFEEGFTKFFLVNGDGGNWMNHWYGLKWDSPVIRSLTEKGMQLEGGNWDQEGGAPYMHGGTHEHALTTWACKHAPEHIQLSAIRHGLKAPDEAVLATLDGVDYRFLEDEPFRATDWSAYKDQPHLRSVTEFSLQQYKELATGPIEGDFDAKIEHLLKKVRGMFE